MTDYYRTEDKTMPAVAYALYLLGFATCGLTTIVGAIIAHSQQAMAGPDMRTHFTYLIRTFWGFLMLAIAAGVVGGVIFAIGVPLVLAFGLGFVFMGFAGLIWTIPMIWFGVRCVVGLVYLSRGEPHPRPYAVLA
ncbi:MAG TPA: hypothetical protein VF495_07555 [Phenylobacterium sp.]|jgi:uncharacterized membrane protein